MMNIKPHTNREYEAELKTLSGRLVLMASRVEEMIKQSVRAFVEHDKKLAENTILQDRRVNLDEIELDEICLLMLAKRQPLGPDLRFVTLALKMVTDIERIGDLAVNICERALKSERLFESHFYQTIDSMGIKVSSMLKDAIDSFVTLNSEQAEAVIHRDDELDHIYHQIIREIPTLMHQSDDMIDPLIHVQSVAKWLERIADHCTNIAELVVFMAQGKDIRHMGKLDEIQSQRLSQF